MKYKIFFYTLIFFIIFTSCKKNEDSELEDRTTIITNGTWMGNTAQATLEFESDLIKALFLRETELSEEDLTQAIPIVGTSVTFNADNTYDAVGLAGESVEGTWELIDNGNQIIINGYELQIPDGFLLPEFEDFKDLIQVTPDNDTYTIKELTENSMTLTAAVPQTISAGTIPNVPLSVDIIINIEINFIR